MTGRDAGRRVRGILVMLSEGEDADGARWAPGARARRARLDGEDAHGACGAFMEKPMPVCEGR
jgi:hypothetical protein